MDPLDLGIDMENDKCSVKWCRGFVTVECPHGSFCAVHWGEHIADLERTYRDRLEGLRRIQREKIVHQEVEDHAGR